MSACPNCGRESEHAAAFCPFCGSRLSEVSPRHEQRKTVTILFCDLVHSTGLAEGDPENYRRIQARFFERMRQIVERHGGTVEKFVGDEVMAVFGVPVAHEDDALRGVRTAKEMLAGLAGLNEELEGALDIRLQVRIGINTGEVVAGDPAEGHAFVAGEPVILAKRLAQAADADQILIGKATYPLVQHAVKAGPLERFSVKGKQDDIGTHRVEDVRRDAPAVARRLQAPIVGRDKELQLLRQAFERVVEESRCRLVAVLGPAGIGKSRLATELLSWVDDRAITSVGRCLSYGEGITFWPLAEALRGLGEPSLRDALSDDDQRDTVLELLDGVTGVSETVSSEQIFWAVRRAFEAIARRRPLIVCFEDLHWAEPTMLDLIEYVVAWIREAPILVVAISRPELVEVRPHWTTPQPSYEALTLGPLSKTATQSLLADLSGDAPLPAEVRDRIAAAAEGNPLFVEQISAMAAEDSSQLTVPPSIQALLAERLDRLSADERDVIERAAVVGRDFPVAAVAGLLPSKQRTPLTPQLLALVRKGLIRPDPSPSGGEDRFSFQHVLVRDAAYNAMPKELRAALHERLADRMADSSATRELDELLGYHLEQAYRYRREVGLFDEHTEQLRLRAGELLAAGGTRALGRNDVHAALKLLERAVALRPEDDPAVRLRLDLAMALFLSGQLAAADDEATETEAQASVSGDDVGELRARLLRARIATQMPSENADSEGTSAELIAVAEEARPVFARAGDDLALAEAWFATAWAQGFIRCHWAAMLEAVEQALDHARRAGSAPWEGELPVWKGSALFYGPTPVDEALRWYEGQQAQHPIAIGQQARLEAMRANFDRARALGNAAHAAAEEFGQKLWLVEGGIAVWEIEMLAGEAAAAERAVRESCELLEELGEVAYRSLAVGQLAASLYALERLDEAQECTRTAEELAPSDDVSSQMVWRQVRALIVARRGHHERAQQLAQEAVSLAKATDMLNFHGNALADLAEVYALSGHADEAREQLEQAIVLYDQKGNLVAAARARRRVQEFNAPAAIS